MSLSWFWIFQAFKWRLGATCGVTLWCMSVYPSVCLSMAYPPSGNMISVLSGRKNATFLFRKKQNVWAKIVFTFQKVFFPLLLLWQFRMFHVILSAQKVFFTLPKTDCTSSPHRYTPNCGWSKARHNAAKHSRLQYSSLQYYCLQLLAASGIGAVEHFKNLQWN